MNLLVHFVIRYEFNRINATVQPEYKNNDTNLVTLNALFFVVVVSFVGGFLELIHSLDQSLGFPEKKNERLVPLVNQFEISMKDSLHRSISSLNGENN